MAPRKRKRASPAMTVPGKTPDVQQPLRPATASGLHVTPTEPIFVHLGLLLPLLNLYPAWALPYAAATCLAYSLGSIALYWSIRRWLRRNGLIERLWNDQVLDAKKSRVSVGTVLSLLDHLHIMLVFGGVFLFAVNALFWFEPKKTWLQALYMGLMAFNLKGFDDFQIPETEVARAICAGLSILSVLFVGFLATAFLKPFVIVFRHK